MNRHTNYKERKGSKAIFSIVWMLLLLLFAKPLPGFAQSAYPVHVSVQVLPPYGVYLTDYYSGSRDRLIVTLLNRDQQQRPLQVKLRVQVKNSSMFRLSSREELYYPMITLESGIPFRLTSGDLAAYLSHDKIRVEGYLKEGKLPTGMTEFSIQAVDYLTGRALSDFGTGRAWLELKQPPSLNMPLKDEQIAYKNPQQIRFQWMPRHQGLANTMYEFVLKELPDNGAPPQAAFAYGFEIYRLQTRFTTLNYSVMEPPLIPGKRYAWQVRAIAKDGMDEIGMFENNGYSEIGWFELNDNCPSVTSVTAKGGYRKMTLEWKSIPEQRAFVVEHRPKSEHNLYEWTSTRTFDNSLLIHQLKPGWKYEYRVGAFCLTDKPVFSPVGEIVLSEDNEERLANCGVPPIIDRSNQQPKEDLKVGDVVIVGGDFPMTVTQLSSQGNGWYSGKGWTPLTWIFEIKVAVKFNRLRVNTDNRQIDGEVESETDPKAGQIGNTNELDYGGSKTNSAKIVFDPQKVDFTVPPVPTGSYDPDSGELILFDTSGQPHVIATQKNEGESIFPMVIEDAEGNKYQIDAPSEQGTAPSGGGGKQEPIINKVESVPTDFDPNKLSAQAGFTVQFSKGKGKYGFDAGKEPWYQRALLIRHLYESLSSDYIVPWKLIPVGESDVVEAELSGKSIDKQKIKFVLKDGTSLPAREEDGKWQLTLPSVKASETYEVLAVYEAKKGKYETVGKLNVVSYPKQKLVVTLIPVDGTVSDVAWTEEELNRIYNPYGVDITVKTDDSLKGNTEWDLDGDGVLNLNGSGFFSKETDEMKALRKLYQQTASGYNRNAYYIFLVNQAKAGDEPDAGLAVQGDMPRGKQFGYIFMRSATNTPQLIAHELGHGIFTLTHSFDVNYSGDKFKAATGNLMDYNKGTELAVWQWNVMSNPAPLTWFDSEDDSKSVGDTNKERNALMQQLTELGTGYALFALKCNSPVPGDGSYKMIEGYRYYLLKLNVTPEGTLSPEIVKDYIPQSEIKPMDSYLQIVPSSQAFLIQNVTENGALTLKLCTVDINDYPAACDTSNPLDIKGFSSQLQKDLLNCQPAPPGDLMDAIVSAVQKQLDKDFFREVTLCVSITSSDGDSRTLQTVGVNSCEEAELRLDIKVNATTGEVETSITPSESYLSEYVDELQQRAHARGLEVDAQSLRRQVINDLKSKDVSRSFFDKLLGAVEPLLPVKVATFVEGVQSSQKIVKNIWEKGEINRGTWYSKETDHAKWPAYTQLHPLLGGTADGVIDGIVGIPVACKDLYNLMADKAQRDAFKNLFSKEGLSQLWVSLKTEASEVLGDTERVEHFGSKTVVQVTSAFLPTKIGAISKLSDVAKKTSDAILPPKVTELLAKLNKADRAKTKPNPKLLRDVEEVIEGIDPQVLEKLADAPGFDKVLGDMATYWTKFQGGKFQLEYAGKLVAAGKKISFEVSDLSDDLKRVYDIVSEEKVVGRMITQSLELKNWKEIYSGPIKTQFIKDLVKMDKLGDIQWVFRKTVKDPFTPQSLREGIMETLRKADVQDEFKKMFNNDVNFKTKMRAIFDTSIENVDDLIEEIGMPDNFNKIFKIAE